MKNITTYLILSCILFKSLEPAIIYVDFLRASKAICTDNTVLKLTANHHTDLDVSPIDKKKDINCTLSGLRINKDLINEFNDKIKDLIDHQDNKSKRSLVLSLDQFSNFIIPEKDSLAFLFTDQKQVNIWNYTVKKYSFFKNIISPPPQFLVV